MSSRTIITTKEGHKIHSSITVETIITEYEGGTTISETITEFINCNWLYHSLTNRELQELIKETQKKIRYIRNKHNLNGD